jgi:signal peptidase I
MEKNHNKKSFLQEYGNYLFLFIVFTLIFIYQFFKEEELKDCHKKTKGEIVAFFEKGPGIHGTKYIYYVDNRKYSRVIVNKFYYNLKNKYFIVLYSCTDYAESVILIEPDDFKEFGYEYPDSLKWVLKYIENK